QRRCADALSAEKPGGRQTRRARLLRQRLDRGGAYRDRAAGRTPEGSLRLQRAAYPRPFHPPAAPAARLAARRPARAGRPVRAVARRRRPLLRTDRDLSATHGTGEADGGTGAQRGGRYACPVWRARPRRLRLLFV